MKFNEVGNATFFNFSEQKSVLNHLGGLMIRLENLFKGSSELEKRTKEFLNENWQDVYRAMRPIVLAIVENIFLMKFVKVLEKIPLCFFFSKQPVLET